MTDAPIPRRAPLGAALLLALLAACAADEAADPSPLVTASRPGTPVATAPAVDAQAGTPRTRGARPPEGDPTRLDIERPELRWDDAPPALGGRRQALLVAVDRYDERNWDLPYALPTAHALRDVLVDTLGFDRDDVVVLSGERVYSDNVQATLRRMTTRLSGPGNVLLIHWVGHGFNIDGRQQFLTYPSRLQAGDYAGTLPYDDLTTWVGDAKGRVREQGGDLEVALVIDACRTRTSAAPGRLVDHVPSVDVEAFASSIGNPATAHATSDLSVFSQGLVEGLSLARGTQVGLLPALERAVDGARFQGAEITTGDQDLVLLDRADLTLVVRAVDFRTGEPIEDATIQLNGVERSGETLFTDLAESETGYDLRVLAPGYFWRVETVPFRRHQSGDLLSVPLVPEFTVLRGDLTLDGAGVARVYCTGAFPESLPGHHLTTQSLPGSGTFLLRIPPTTGERSLVIEVNGNEVRRLPFDLAQRPPDVVHLGGVPVKVVDFGAHVVVPGRPSTDLGTPVAPHVIGSIEVAFDLRSLSPDDFVDDRGWSFYTTVRSFIEEERYQDAHRDLEALLASGRVRSASRPVLDDLLTELDVSRTMASAAEAQGHGDMQAAIRILADSPVSADRRVRPVLVSWLRPHAVTRAGEGDPAHAALLIDQALQVEPRDPELLALRIRAHEAWMQQSFDNALQDGEWQRPRSLLATLTPAGTLDVTGWQRQIEHESISAATRRSYELALAALSDGQLEQAWRLFGRALASGSNAHYARLIEEQRRELADTLFAKYGAIGAERDRAGDKPAAFVAYAQAWEYDPLVTHRLERLLDDPEVETAEPELVAAFKERRTARRALEAVDNALSDDELDHAEELLGAARRLPAIDHVRVDQLQADLATRRAAEAAENAQVRRAALAAIRDLQVYARLDRAEVEALCRVAETEWPEVFGDEFQHVGVERFTAGGATYWIAGYRHNRTGLEFSLIPGGEARIGSAKQEIGRTKDEGPIHAVELAPMLMARTEVSQATWQRGGKPLPEGLAHRGGTLPITHVTWAAAQAWCQGVGLSLPTEAQWEFACRGGVQRPTAFGQTLRSSQANIESMEPRPIGSHDANAFGLRDMHGNVFEWCRDWFGSYRRNTRPRTGERLVTPSSLRVIRGGSYAMPPDRARSASRTGSTPSTTSAELGFRPVRTLAR